jgi:hypothetical protein
MAMSAAEKKKRRRAQRVQYKLEKERREAEKARRERANELTGILKGLFQKYGSDLFVPVVLDMIAPYHMEALRRKVQWKDEMDERKRECARKNEVASIKRPITKADKEHRTSGQLYSLASAKLDLVTRIKQTVQGRYLPFPVSDDETP